MGKEIDLHIVDGIYSLRILESISVDDVREREHLVRTRRLVMPFWALGKMEEMRMLCTMAFAEHTTTAKAPKRFIPKTCLPNHAK